MPRLRSTSQTRHQLRVQDHPLITQLHDRPVRLHKELQFLLGEFLIIERDPPAEVHQLGR
ncbi:hypothetical protein BJY54_005769 [Streptomyces nodosus]|nr:hypothetical protein [Streptomyces nodosus]